MELELINAGALIKDALASADPCFLPFVLIAAWNFRRIQSVASMITNQVADMADIILGQSHPSSQIYRYICSNGFPDYDHSIALISRAVVDHFAVHLGPLHPVSTDTKIWHLHISMDPAIASDVDRAFDIERERLKDAPNSRSLEFRLEYGWRYYDHRLLPEAQAHAQYVLDNTRYRSSERLRRHFRDATHLLALILKSLGDLGAAETTLKELIRLIKSEKEDMSDWTYLFVESLIDLEDWYLEWGMPNKAFEIRVERLEVQVSTLKLA